MEYGASAEDVARVCHAHPVSYNINYYNIFKLQIQNVLSDFNYFSFS